MDTEPVVVQELKSDCRGA